MKLPDFTVTGRIALITGAGRGLGVGMANALAAAGAAVMIQDIEPDVAAAEAEKINQAGGRAQVAGGDATDPDFARQIYDSCVEKLGPPDILINNASVQKWQDFAEHTAEEMQRQVDANILAPVKLCQLAVPHMIQQKWGRILNIGSIQGKSGNSHMPVYAMSKIAMVNLTQSLCRRYGHDGILVNCIAPGWMDTFRNRDDLADPVKKARNASRIPVPRLGQPDDMAGITLLLCSEAGSYITGQTIYVDGGMGA